MDGNLVILLAVGSLILLIALVATRQKSEVEARLEDAAFGKRSAAKPEEELLAEVPAFGLFKMLMPSNQQGRRQVGDRLVQAGLYKRNSYGAYIVTKGMLVLVPVVMGFFLGSTGMVAPKNGLILGGIVSLFGMILPSFWLDKQLKARQMSLRRALPDALDVIVICLEGGLSLPAAFSKVTSDLRTVHPMLAAEMAIVLREIQMGRTTGEALKNFAMRFDLEELRSMASVVLQAERFGSSVVKALSVHSDSLRERRMHVAEELAQKASIKILFPTLFFIFPTIFIVLLGPAAFDMVDVMMKMTKRSSSGAKAGAK